MSTNELSAEDKRTLSRMFDEIIPPSEDGRLPGAGSLELTEYVEEVLPKTPELEPVVTEGLAVVSDLARERGCDGYAELPGGAAREVLKTLEEKVPAFLPALTFLAYSGYYSDARILHALGLEARAPYPRGYEVPPTDFAMLERVRRRGRRWRQC